MLWGLPRGGGELKPLTSGAGPTVKVGGFFSSARGSKSSSSLSAVVVEPLRPLVVGGDGSSARGLKSSSSLVTPFEITGLELGRMSLKTPKR